MQIKKTQYVMNLVFSIYAKIFAHFCSLDCHPMTMIEDNAVYVSCVM